MTADEIFKVSVDLMKKVLKPEEMTASLKRARERGDARNLALLEGKREDVNELVRKIAGPEGLQGIARDVSQETLDAMVLRYLRNREIFMKTFPDGIEGIDADHISIWASIMISPMDEQPVP